MSNEPTGPWKDGFSLALGAVPGRLHFAAHSHHLWPDVTRGAQQQAWDDGVRLADRKWGPVYEDLVPRVQRAAASRLSLSEPEDIVFGPNTHSFVVRILSCLPPPSPSRPWRVLTTDGEFHSFRRQVDRYAQEGLARVERVPVAPFDTFEERLCAGIVTGGWDLVYTSQVFFDSGFGLSDTGMTAAVHAVRDDDTFVVIDGYHGFMARPTDLSGVEGRAFYLGGGYKYAMAGEGACFLHAPRGYGARPRDTGWFAAFGGMSSETKAGEVPFGVDATRFAGATLDPTPLHRFAAVQEWLASIDVTVDDIHRHATSLQDRFLAGLTPGGALSDAKLITPRAPAVHGNFLVFVTPRAADIDAALDASGVVVDHRADRLRVGFGMYQDHADVDALLERLAAL